MKKTLCIIFALLVLLSNVSAFDLNDVNQMKDLIGNYGKDLVNTLPAEVSVDNLWADAYIGQLLGIPPHFGVGVNVGAAFIGNNELLANVGEIVGVPALSMLPGAPVPALSLNARVGGIILPFDVGIHGMFFKLNADRSNINGKIKINTWGADFRYCLLKQMLIIPAVSVGVGYDSIDTSADMMLSSLNVNFATKASLVSATAEASWKLLILKIFAGARAMLPLNDGITFSATASASGLLNTDPILAVNKDLSVHLFGGIGLRLLVLDTTIGATYDLTNKNLGASISTRIQL